MWLSWPAVLGSYARHHETGSAMPETLVEQVTTTDTFGEGFATLEYLKAALLDWAWHNITVDDVVDDADAFEAAALESAGVDFALVGPRYRTSYFAHIFGGGYAAGYYSYIWSEVLDADTVEWFEENGGLTRDNGEHFRRTLLARGGTRDPMDAFREFRGLIRRDEDRQRLRQLLLEGGASPPGAGRRRRVLRGTPHTCDSDLTARRAEAGRVEPSTTPRRDLTPSR